MMFATFIEKTVTFEVRYEVQNLAKMVKCKIFTNII